MAESRSIQINPFNMKRIMSIHSMCSSNAESDRFHLLGDHHRDWRSAISMAGSLEIVRFVLFRGDHLNHDRLRGFLTHQPGHQVDNDILPGQWRDCFADAFCRNSMPYAAGISAIVQTKATAKLDP